MSPRPMAITDAPMEMIKLLPSALLISGQRALNSVCQLNSVGLNCSQGMSDGLVKMTLGCLKEVISAQ